MSNPWVLATIGAIILAAAVHAWLVWRRAAASPRLSRTRSSPGLLSTGGGEHEAWAVTPLESPIATSTPAGDARESWPGGEDQRPGTLNTHEVGQADSISSPACQFNAQEETAEVRLEPDPAGTLHPEEPYLTDAHRQGESAPSTGALTSEAAEGQSGETITLLHTQQELSVSVKSESSPAISGSSAEALSGSVTKPGAVEPAVDGQEASPANRISAKQREARGICGESESIPAETARHPTQTEVPLAQEGSTTEETEAGTDDVNRSLSGEPKGKSYTGVAAIEQEAGEPGGDEKTVSGNRATVIQRRPPKYQPSIRTAEATKRTKRPRQAERDDSCVRSLSMSVHVLFAQRNWCRVSLLPTRAGLSEEIGVSGPDGDETWYACQDEWYGDISPSNVGSLLEKGAEWEADQNGGDQLRWILSGREIYVLAPCSTISGFVLAPRLILNEDHLVLCTKRQEEAVRQALNEAGCPEPTSVAHGHGVPGGWVLFQGVRPTVAVHHDGAVGIFNILRPVHDLEIVFGGGIRLSHSTWLNRYPPQIRIRGASGDEVKVMIDGKLASADANGNYTASGWDSPGLHNVFCGGVTQSYELQYGLQEWEAFNAFAYRAGRYQTGERAVTICGPIVVTSDHNSDVLLAPATNTCLLGTAPGQIALSPQPYDVRTPEFLAIASFPVVWALPANTLQCNRSEACVKLIRSEGVVTRRGSAASGDRHAMLRWCYAILNASRKRLRVEPETGEAEQLWAQYKKAARQLRRQLR